MYYYVRDLTPLCNQVCLWCLQLRVNLQVVYSLAWCYTSFNANQTFELYRTLGLLESWEYDASCMVRKSEGADHSPLCTRDFPHSGVGAVVTSEGPGILCRSVRILLWARHFKYRTWLHGYGTERGKIDVAFNPRVVCRDMFGMEGVFAPAFLKMKKNNEKNN